MDRRLSQYIIGTILLASVHAIQLSEVPVCSAPNYTSKGYTYAIDKNTSEKVWSHCWFPSPVHDHALCGRPVTTGRYFLCDPDGVLDNSAHDIIDLHLYNIQSNTSTLCVAPHGDKQSYIMAILVINRIRVPDLRSPSICLNDCNELQPELDLTQRSPSDEEQTEIMKNFADNVRTLWGLGACDNDVLVLYCKQFNKMYISAGSRATKYLTRSKIDSMTEAFTNNLNDADFETGLLHAISALTDSLRIALRATTIARALMISNIVVVLVFGVWFFYYLFVRKLETNVWGQEKPFQFLELCFQFATGIWLIKTMLLALAAMSNSKTGLIYALIATGIAMAGCFAMYGFSVNVYHGY